MGLAGTPGRFITSWKDSHPQPIHEAGYNPLNLGPYGTPMGATHAMGRVPKPVQVAQAPNIINPTPGLGGSFASRASIEGVGGSHRLTNSVTSPDASGVASGLAPAQPAGPTQAQLDEMRRNQGQALGANNAAMAGYLMS